MAQEGSFSRRLLSRREAVVVQYLTHFLRVDDVEPHGLLERLKDGVLLCDFANAIIPNAVTEIHRPEAGHPLKAYQARENVEEFLALAHAKGVNKVNLFQPVDLVKENDWPQVVFGILKFVEACKDVIQDFDDLERRFGSKGYKDEGGRPQVLRREDTGAETRDTMIQPHETSPIVQEETPQVSSQDILREKKRQLAEKLADLKLMRRESESRADMAVLQLAWRESLVVEYIEDVLKLRLPQDDLHGALRDGIVLCHVVNAIEKGSVLHIVSERGHCKSEEMLENSKAFLRACRQLGMEETSLFRPEDLVEKNNWAVVVQCVLELAEVGRAYISAGDSVLRKLGKSPGARRMLKPRFSENEGKMKAGDRLGSIKEIRARVAQARLLSEEAEEHQGTPFEVASRTLVSQEEHIQEMLEQVLNIRIRRAELPMRLHDGALVCQLAKALHAGSFPHIHSEPRMETERMENWKFYFKACRDIGLSEDTLFDPREDLSGEWPQVVDNILKFTEVAKGRMPPHLDLGDMTVRLEGTEHFTTRLDESEVADIKSWLAMNTPRTFYPSPRLEQKDNRDRVDAAWDEILRQRRERLGETTELQGDEEEEVERVMESISSDGGSLRRPSRKALRQLKLDNEEALLIQYIEGLLGIFIEHEYLYSAMQDGVLLCELANILEPGSVPEYLFREEGLLEPEMKENVNSFLDACRRMGMPGRDLFRADDLVHGNNWQFVVESVLTLIESRMVKEGRHVVSVESKGKSPPKASRKGKRVQWEDRLDEGDDEEEEEMETWEDVIAEDQSEDFSDDSRVGRSIALPLFRDDESAARDDDELGPATVRLGGAQDTRIRGTKLPIEILEAHGAGEIDTEVSAPLQSWDIGRRPPERDAFGREEVLSIHEGEDLIPPPGLLKIRVVKARRLQSPQALAEKVIHGEQEPSVDSYVRVRVGPFTQRTEFVPSSGTETYWDAGMQFAILEDGSTQTVQLSVWSGSVVARDEFVGETSIPIGYLLGRSAADGIFDEWVPIRTRSGHRKMGEINIVSTFLAKEYEVKVEEEKGGEGEEEEEETLPQSGTLTIRVVKGRNLRDKSFTGHLSPFVRANLLGTEKQTNPDVNGSVNPRWDSVLEFLLDQDDGFPNLLFSVWDRDQRDKNDLLGEHLFSTKDLIQCVHMAEWLPLLTRNQKPTGEIFAIMDFVPSKEPTLADMIPEVRPPKVAPPKDYTGIVRVRVIQARNLHGENATGTLNPFVRLRVGKVKKQTVAMWSASGEPRWDTTFDVRVYHDVGLGQMEITVWDTDLFAEDNLIGEALLNLIDVYTIPHYREWIQLRDKKAQLSGEVLLELEFTSDLKLIAEQEEKMAKSEAMRKAAEVARKTEEGVNLIEPAVVTDGGGFLKILAVKARELPGEDSDKMSPLVKFRLGKDRRKTDPCFSGGTHPQWDAGVEFHITGDAGSSILEFSVCNHDALGDKDVLVSESLFPVKKLKNTRGLFEDWIELVDKNGEPGGELLLRLSFTSTKEAELLSARRKVLGVDVATLELKELLLVRYIGHYGQVTVPRDDLQNALRDGTVLCRMANGMLPKIVPRVITFPKPLRLRNMRENVRNFLHACRSVGVGNADLFEPGDLLHDKNWPLVIHCCLVMIEKAGKEVKAGMFHEPAPTPATSAVREMLDQKMKPATVPFDAAGPRGPMLVVSLPDLSRMTEMIRVLEQQGASLRTRVEELEHVNAALSVALRRRLAGLESELCVFKRTKGAKTASKYPRLAHYVELDDTFTWLIGKELARSRLLWEAEVSTLREATLTRRHRLETQRDTALGDLAGVAETFHHLITSAGEVMTGGEELGQLSVVTSTCLEKVRDLSHSLV